MKLVSFAVATVLMFIAAVPSMAATCRDTKGKFVKCPDKPTKKAICKNAKGQFAKCGSTGAKPI